MSDNVLREFLVSLGFKVDEAGLKKFGTAVEGVTKSVMEAGVAVAGTATAIVAGVKIISNQMENLYYASQRTGATVGNIMALRYAAGQIGLTADQAQGALENFARTLRLNPGSGSLLDSLGVKGGDPAQRFTSFIEKMKGLQPYVAAAYAQLFGIDPDTLLMLENGLPKLEEEQKKYAAKLARFGIDPDQAAQAGKDFNNSIRAVKDTFNDLWIVIESKLAPVLTPLVDQFERWAENHAGEVAQGIAEAVQNLATWIQSVDWKKVGDDIVKVYHALGGLKGILIGLAAIKLMPLAAAVLNLASAVLGLGKASTALSATGALGILGKLGIAGLASYAGLRAAKALGLPDVDAQQGKKDLKHGDWLAASAHMSAGDFISALWDKLKGAKASDVVGSVHGPDSSMHTASGAVRPSLQDAYSAAKEAQDRYGIPAQITLAQYGLESGFGKRMPPGSNNPFGIKARDGQPYVEAETTEYVNGVAQRVKQKFAKFDSLADAFDAHARLLAYGKPYADARSHNDDPNAFADSLTGVYATDPKYGAKLRSVMASLDSTRLGVRSSSPPAVSINQTNTFSIAGTNDPQGTARAVGAEQSRINGDMVRNFAGAFS
jgi:hypothetical protein